MFGAIKSSVHMSRGIAVMESYDRYNHRFTLHEKKGHIVGSCLACTLHTTTRISNVKSIYCKIKERCHKHGISFVLCIGYMYFGKTAYYVLIAAEPECKCFNVQSHHTIHTKEIGLGESDLDNNVTTILCIFETSKTLTAPAWSTAT